MFDTDTLRCVSTFIPCYWLVFVADCLMLTKPRLIMPAPLACTASRAFWLKQVGHGRGKSNLAEGLATALCERQPSLTVSPTNAFRPDLSHHLIPFPT